MKLRRLFAVAAVLMAVGAGTAVVAHPRHHFSPRHHFRPHHRAHIGLSFHFGYPFYGYPFYGYHPWAPYAYYPGWVGYPVPVAPPDFGFVDLDVRPEEAEVWVGDELVGIADDFDGYPDVLVLRRGRRTVVLRHPGYRDLRLRLEVPAGAEVRVRRRMVPLPGAEP